MFKSTMLRSLFATGKILTVTTSILLFLVTVLPSRFRGEASPVSCSGQCIISRNACNAACNGNAECMAICQSEYECCILACHGGSCRQATSKARPSTQPKVAAAITVPRFVAAASTDWCDTQSNYCWEVGEQRVYDCEFRGEGVGPDSAYTSCACQGTRAYKSCMDFSGCSQKARAELRGLEHCLTPQ